MPLAHEGPGAEQESARLASITVATLQPSLARLDRDANFEAIRRMVHEVAARQPVDLIVLPEALDGEGPDVDGPGVSEATSSDVRQFIVELATSAGAGVVGGSVAHRHGDGPITNTCLLADRTGRIVGEYAKRKLFATEADTRTAGRTPGIFDLSGLRVGVLICADLWYPELARELCGRVDVLCVPAKTTVPSAESVPYARTVWWSLAMTRAVENALPVVVSDWCEQAHATGFTSGATSVNDPAGRPDPTRLQRRMDDGQPGVLIAQIDLDAVAEIRQYRRAVGLLARKGE